jgi:hypothetical protein
VSAGLACLPLPRSRRSKALMVGLLRTPATLAIYKGTRQNRTVLYAKAGVPDSGQALIVIGAVRSRSRRLFTRRDTLTPAASGTRPCLARQGSCCLLTFAP